MKGDMGGSGVGLPKILKPGSQDAEDDFFCYACRDTGKTQGLLVVGAAGPEQKTVDCDNGRCAAHRHFLVQVVHVERELCAQTVEMLNPPEMPRQILDNMAGLIGEEKMTVREVLKAACRGTADCTKEAAAGMIREWKGP